ncbi:MAG: hypothetical protein DHS20C21_11880 [Gemmatimonadota bacterium]|nr:MAG: hypothetical protein DHS20C21_11880 [Gemmatimonadota bacterium]
MILQSTREAIEWAVALHGDQKRKGSDIPYLFHLLAVASLVADHDGTETEIVAAILHDAIEDAGGSDLASAIRERFGPEVLAIVDACSDAREIPKPPWRDRKTAFVDSLSGASDSTKLVVAADKIHNATCTIRNLRLRGAEVWSLFRGGRDGTLWYYDSVLAALRDGWSHPVLHELDAAVRELHELADLTP